ncbi:MAG TPA: glutamine--tRNA ligase, partial [Chitinophagaceae bacterium]|nr:glutamine--tRNA ligase [Chitinophagaceae bacterium]
FSRELWIEREDFMEVAPKKWFRLAPGSMVRLKSAYVVQCTGYSKDEAGRVTEIQCEYFPESRSGSGSTEFQVKGTIHWVSVPHAETAEVRLYDRLFKVENPAAEEGDFKEYINPDSLQVIEKAYVEPSLLLATMDDRYQFIRKGYFCLDKEAQPGKMIFNRTATLKDTWVKQQSGES